MSNAINIFELASRRQYRFDTPQGKFATEDLWALPLSAISAKANLDDIARGLNRKIKALGEEESFVTETKSSDGDLKNMFEIVKHIIGIRLAEKAAADKTRENRAKKQQLLSLIESKQNEALGTKSVEDLLKMVEELD